MNFYDQEFLLKRFQNILSFYDPNVADRSGGYQQNYKDDGSLFNTGFKHLVSSTRIVVNYATAARALNRQDYLETWYRVLHRDSRKHSDEKSTAGAKCDYHTFGSCFQVLAGLSLPELQ